MSTLKPTYRKRALLWARDIALFLLLFTGLQWWLTKDMPSGMAPELNGVLINGDVVSLQDLRGTPVMVHFWATWCPVCQLENDNIAGIAEDYKVISVATNSGTAREIDAFLKEHQLQMPVLLDESGDLARQWKVVGVPVTFIINSLGEIDYVTRGYSTELWLKLKMALAS
jgi:peroxiredoxin